VSAAALAVVITGVLVGFGVMRHRANANTMNENGRMAEHQRVDKNGDLVQNIDTFVNVVPNVPYARTAKRGVEQQKQRLEMRDEVLRNVGQGTDTEKKPEVKKAEVKKPEGKTKMSAMCDTCE
jgi:alpha-L-fucosidase